MMSEQITSLELEAYLDGELDAERRLAVEDYLARNPTIAARMMADMSLCTALQIAQPTPAPNLKLTDIAAQLDARLAPQRGFWSRARWFSLAASAVAVIGAVLVVPHKQESAAPPPTYVADAVESFETGLLRASMPSQIETPRFDAHDVRRYTRIRVPALPEGWGITDVQIFPSDEGPALQIMIRTPDNKALSMFAVRSKAAAPDRPITIQQGKTAVSYWRKADMAYALTGTDSPAMLNIAARDLADNRIG
jgi:anti-sigma factor RsiW